MKSSDALQNDFILTQRMQNLEYVNLKCVTYAQPIPLPLMTKVIWFNFNQKRLLFLGLRALFQKQKH